MKFVCDMRGVRQICQSILLIVCSVFFLPSVAEAELFCASAGRNVACYATHEDCAEANEDSGHPCVAQPVAFCFTSVPTDDYGVEEPDTDNVQHHCFRANGSCNSMRAIDIQFAAERGHNVSFSRCQRRSIQSEVNPSGSPTITSSCGRRPCPRAPESDNVDERRGERSQSIGGRPDSWYCFSERFAREGYSTSACSTSLRDCESDRRRESSLRHLGRTVTSECVVAPVAFCFGRGILTGCAPSLSECDASANRNSVRASLGYQVCRQTVHVAGNRRIVDDLTPDGAVNDGNFYCVTYRSHYFVGNPFGRHRQVRYLASICMDTMDACEFELPTDDSRIVRACHRRSTAFCIVESDGSRGVCTENGAECRVQSQLDSHQLWGESERPRPCLRQRQTSMGSQTR